MPVPKGFKEKPAGFPMSRCARKSIRVKELTDDKRLLICCPKGKYDTKRRRCRVGTRATRIQTRMSGKK